MGLPSIHAASAMLIALAMFYGFINGKLKVEIVSLLTIGVIALVLYVFPMPGQHANAGLELAFEGFGHYALVTICALMIIGRGLVVTGALDPAARALARVWKFNKSIGLLVTLVVCLFMSMLINDTPVLVLMIPILVQMATRGGIAASKTLMPVNAAILIGGMSTSIGTSTNLLVVSIAQDLGMKAIPVFQFTPIVLCAVVVALPYIWLVMPRLLPDNTKAVAPESRTYLAKMRIGGDSPARGKTIEEVRGLVGPDIAAWIPAGQSGHVDRRIYTMGTMAELREAARKIGAQMAPSWVESRIENSARRTSSEIIVVEMIVGPDSRLIGLTPKTAGFEGAAMLGIHHARQPLRDTRPNTPDAPMREGDVLVLKGTPESLSQFAQSEGLLQIEGGEEVVRSAKAPLALAIMAGAVGLASVGLVPIAITSLAGAILMFTTGCVRFDRVGRALSAQVIVLVAASIALGKYIMVSGAAAWLGGLMADGLQYLPPAGVLAAIMVFVTILTNFASNSAAAAVGTPIAFNIAHQLHLPPEPLVLAVLFGCNLCYATPVAYQTNMMILSEGDYKFADYVRAGVPLVVIMVAALSTSLVYWYGI